MVCGGAVYSMIGKINPGNAYGCDLVRPIYILALIIETFSGITI
jgi:hypothetical protein